MEDKPGNDLPVEGAPKSEALVAFSAGLNSELDAIGYAAHPRRSTALAKELSVGRTQAYRLLNGLSGPSIETLAVLRGMGVSVDRLLDDVNGGQQRPTIAVLIDGHSVAAVPRRCRTHVLPLVAAVPVAGDQYELHRLAPGQGAPANAIPIEGLSFPSRFTIAVIDDDAPTLDVLGRELSSAFQVVSFQTGHALIGFAHGLAGFNAFLVDWRLPDIDGGSLIQRIRRSSAAPIFIITGYTSSDSTEIARALNGRNVHHVAKPADGLILIKRMSDAIKQDS